MKNIVHLPEYTGFGENGIAEPDGSAIYALRAPLEPDNHITSIPKFTDQPHSIIVMKFISEEYTISTSVHW